MKVASDIKNNLHTWQVPAIVVLGAALRLIHLGARSFRTDEGIIAQLAQLDFPGVLRASLENSTPAGLNLQLHVMYLLFGNSQFVLSLVPLLYGVLTIYFTYLLASRYLSRDIGLMASFLVAVSPYCVFISQELRPYSLMTLTILASCYFFLRYLESGEKKFWLLALIFTIGATYSHFFGWSVLIIENIYFFLRTKHHSRYILSWLGLQILVILAFSPTLLGTLNVLDASGVSTERLVVSNFGFFLYSAVKKTFGAVLHFAGGYYFFDLPIGKMLSILRQPGQGLMLLIMFAVPWIFLVAGSWKLFKWKSWPNLIIVLMFLIPVSVLLIEGTNPNYYSPASPAFFIILGVGILALVSFWRRILVTAYLIMCGVALLHIYSSPVNTFLTEDYQGLARYLDQNRSTGEAVVFWGGSNASHAWNYYDRYQSIYMMPGWSPQCFLIARVDKPRPQTFMRADVFPNVMDSLLAKAPRAWYVIQGEPEEIETLFPPLQQSYQLELRSRQPYLNLLEIRKRSPKL